MKNDKDYLNIDFKEKNSSDNTYQTTFNIPKTSKIERLIEDEKLDDALSEINRILVNDKDCTNWSLKGIILDKSGKYEKAVECFDNALELNDSDEIKSNKANSLYNWAKITFFPEGNYDKALNLIDDALNTLPNSEDSSEFHFLKAEILEALNELVESYKSYLIAHGQFDRLNEFESQCEYLNNAEDIIISIVGCSFYNFTPERGIIIDLVKDLENEHDPDAIAAVKDNEIVGYVANSPHTLIDEVKSASDIKNSIKDNQKAEILFDFLGEYTIAKLI